MRIEIDQSGKIEDTNRLTVVAYSDGESGSILISGKDKRLIQRFYRDLGQPKIFVYKLFAVLIYVLIKDKLSCFNQIIIDTEYLGYEKLIRSFIIEIISKQKQKIRKDVFSFHSIGEKSRAHKVAIKSFTAKRADLKLTYRQFRKYIFK